MWSSAFLQMADCCCGNGTLHSFCTGNCQPMCWALVNLICVSCILKVATQWVGRRLHVCLSICLSVLLSVHWYWVPVGLSCIISTLTLARQFCGAAAAWHCCKGTPGRQVQPAWSAQREVQCFAAAWKQMLLPYRPLHRSLLPSSSQTAGLHVRNVLRAALFGKLFLS